MIWRWLQEKGWQWPGAEERPLQEARRGEVEEVSLPRAGPVKTQPAERFFTPAALRRAWLAIKRAGGGAGVDGVSLAAFEKNLDAELESLRDELVRGIYRPHPVRRVLVPKGDGGLRPLAVWVLRDRIAQRAVYEILVPSFESIFLPVSFGFRPGLGVEDAVAQLSRHRDNNLRWVVDGDIEQCFDSLDSRLLLKLTARRVHDRLLLGYVRGWLQADILNSVDGVPRKAGASQGSALSPLLANIYLHEFDRALTGKKLALVRYADDFVVCCRRKTDAEKAQAEAERALSRLGLTLNQRKSRIVHLDAGLGWLGYFFVRQECYRV
ncbi:MAG: hypothetical protein KJZ86_23080 [Caldilineaceae bacterium]|nr:hypothetical protein [Caldilineaceae bacterium]